MIKRDEVQDFNSCLNKAHPDEPIFVLRGNDECAPETIESWARRYMAQKTAENKGELTPQQRAKFNEALELARKMREWKAQQR